MEKGKTAILYFAYRPELEALRKPIFSDYGVKVNASFYRELQEELFTRLTPLAIPLVHIDDTKQRGDTFADRMCNAVEDMWQMGYDRIMILGNDCPELNVEEYQQTLELLDKGHSCLVATQNGGAGLIALHRKQYRREHWLELQWQSEHTFDDLFDCLSKCKVLDTKVIELNHLADCYAYIETHKGDDEISYFIDGILNPLRNLVVYQNSGAERSVQLAHKFRGPPFKA